MLFSCRMTSYTVLSANGLNPLVSGYMQYTPSPGVNTDIVRRAIHRRPHLLEGLPAAYAGDQLLTGRERAPGGEGGEVLGPVTLPSYADVSPPRIPYVSVADQHTTRA